MHFLRNSNIPSLVRAVALTKAGSGILRFASCSNYDADKSEGAVTDAGDSPTHSCGCLGRHTIANAIAKVAPAVVSLSVPEAGSIGSGTIIDDNGTILTCAHVMDVPGSAGHNTLYKKVTVTLQDGRSFEGTLVNAKSDIATLSIEPKSLFPVAKLGSSRKLRPGDWVVAMGSPLGFQNTVTLGIVSCVDRKSRDLGLGGMLKEYLQTDCAINKGNSGGPLVNVDGEVVGVNVMNVREAYGLSFAVPIDSVLKIIEDFKQRRLVRLPGGWTMMDLNDSSIAALKKASYPEFIRGVLVTEVYKGSPVDCSGIRKYDVIVELGGSPVRSTMDVVKIIERGKGKSLKAVVKREQNVSQTLTVFTENPRARL